MNQKHQRGPQGVRQDKYSGSKVTNRARFDPWGRQVNDAYLNYLRRLRSDEAKPIVEVEQRGRHGSEIMPLSGDDVFEAFKSIPDEFTHDLAGVFSLGAISDKHNKNRFFVSLWYLLALLYFFVSISQRV